MAVPGFEAFLLPVLRAYSDGRDLPTLEARARVASGMGLDENDLAERLPNSPQLRATNRTNWAQIYLQRAGLLERLRRGVYKVTDRGRKLLETSPTTLTMADLGRYPDFREWRRVDDEGADKPSGPATAGTNQTPDEALDSAFKVVRSKIEKDLLDRILAGSPELLERIAIRLVEEMGYGRPGDGAHLGHSGMGGSTVSSPQTHSVLTASTSRPRGTIPDARCRSAMFGISSGRWNRNEPSEVSSSPPPAASHGKLMTWLIESRSVSP